MYYAPPRRRMGALSPYRDPSVCLSDGAAAQGAQLSKAVWYGMVNVDLYSAIICVSLYFLLCFIVLFTYSVCLSVYLCMGHVA